MEAIALANAGAYTIMLSATARSCGKPSALGEAPEHMFVVGDVKASRTVQVKNPEKVGLPDPDHLVVDDTREIVAVLKRRFRR